MRVLLRSIVARLFEGDIVILLILQDFPSL